MPLPKSYYLYSNIQNQVHDGQNHLGAKVVYHYIEKGSMANLFMKIIGLE
jgi:hypothetical protein